MHSDFQLFGMFNVRHLLHCILRAEKHFSIGAKFARYAQSTQYNAVHFIPFSNMRNKFIVHCPYKSDDIHADADHANIACWPNESRAYTIKQGAQEAGRFE